MSPAKVLPRKRKIRSGHRASTTRMVGQIATALEDVADRDRLALLKLTLSKKLDTLNKLNLEIIKLITDKELDKIQQSDDYKEKI